MQRECNDSICFHNKIELKSRLFPLIAMSSVLYVILEFNII